MAGHRIRTGTHTVTNMTADYDITLFPKQSDQGEFRWFSPVDPSGNVKEVAVVEDAMDGSRGGFGDREFSWFLGALTAGMVAYIRSAIFAGGWTAEVTVRTWDRSSGWIVVNCTAQWNDPGANFEGAFTGYANLRIDFIKGTLAAA